jgi:hypothetical protein
MSGTTFWDAWFWFSRNGTNTVSTNIILNNPNKPKIKY